MKRQTMKPGRRPRDLALAQRHWDRRRTKTDLRTLRYLRAPRLYLPDFTIGAVMGFGVLAGVMTIAGLMR